MDLSPKQIVYKLDKYIIGQDEAKKAVAIALRNRYRRAQLPVEIREEITPKNIIMKGPTGVGKTEIARRLAKLVKAPFVKVEATKYTEVGYVGKDVEGMIRDLAECAYRLVKAEKEEQVKAKATAHAEKRIVRALAEAKKEEKGDEAREVFENRLLEGLRRGDVDNFTIEMEVVLVPPAKTIDRLGVDQKTTTLLGLEIPSLAIPVTPGRNLAVLIEVAARNQQLKSRGILSAQQFSQKVLNRMKQKTRNHATEA